MCGPTLPAPSPGPHLSWLGTVLKACWPRPPTEGVVATGYVADLAAAYAGCTIAVAPLLRGAGVKVKVPQALAYGLPVVTTTVGGEGFPPGCPAVVTDDPREMARAIADLLLSPARVPGTRRSRPYLGGGGFRLLALHGTG